MSECDDLILGCADNYSWHQIKYWANSIDASGFRGKKAIIMLNGDAETARELEKRDFSIISFGRDKQGNFTYRSPFRLNRPWNADGFMDLLWWVLPPVVHEYYHLRPRTSRIAWFRNELYRNNLTTHVERFYHFWHFLNEYSPPTRYVIATDVRDVVFQTNPSAWLDSHLEGRKYCCPSELMRYGDDVFFGNENLLHCFGPQLHSVYKDRVSYNVGVLAGEHKYMSDLCLLVFQLSINRPIPVVDQIAFNFIMWQEPFASITKFCSSEDGWSAQAGNTVDPRLPDHHRAKLLEPVPELVGDLVKTHGGKTFCVVHQYDRVPTWKRLIEAKYSGRVAISGGGR